MSNDRRAKAPGGSYFFTVVTYRRQPLLTLAESRVILRSMIRQTRQKHPFAIDAWVLLCIASGPCHRAIPTTTRGIVKGGFSKQARKLFHRPEWINRSKAKHRESTIGQRRFWEHGIRDQDDFNRHFDDIHWNPVNPKTAVGTQKSRSC